MSAQKENHEIDYYLKLLVKSSFFIFFAIVVSKLASYGYKILIARYFGAETYGLFSLGLIIITLISSIATLGLNDGLVRYISLYRGKKKFGYIRRLVISLRNIFLIVGILFTMILVAFAPIIGEKIFHTEKFTPLLMGMAFSLPFLLLSNLYLGVLRGFEHVRTYSALINIYQNTFRLIILFLLIMMGVGVIAVSISYVLVFVGLFILSNYYAKKDLNKMPKSVIPKSNLVVPEVFSYAWPLLFVGILYSIFYWTDSLLLGYFTNAENVGWYSAATTVISLFGIAPDIFMQLFFPLISFKSSEGKKEIIKRLTQQVTKWIYLINIPLFILLFLFSDYLLGILFGSEFLIAGSILKILACGALFSSVVGISTSLISIKGKTKMVLSNFLVFTIINILLNILLIPRSGMIGAAIATLITQVLFSITLIVQIKKMYGFNLIRSLRKRLVVICMGLLVMGVYLVKNFEIGLYLALVISIIFIFSYLVCLYIFKLFDNEDFIILKSIASKIGLRKNQTKKESFKKLKYASQELFL